jgi:hypothetical protein
MPSDGCEWCRWRRYFLPEGCDDGWTMLHEGDDHDCARTRRTYIRAGYARHVIPQSLDHVADCHAILRAVPLVWRDILKTHKLGAGSFMLEPGWFRFPTRNMRPLSAAASPHFQSVTEYIKDYDQNVHFPNSDGTFTVFHMVQTNRLVTGDEKALGSTGILHDGGMHYGSHHGDGIGVYVRICVATMGSLLRGRWMVHA